MEKETEKLVAEAHRKITRIKGMEYSPTADEISNQVNKMTAVQWLVMRYHQRQGVLKDEDIDKAKEVEKEQIKDAYWNGTFDIDKEEALLEGEEYYNETYNKSN